MNFIDIANEYTNSRIICEEYQRNVLRIANNCGEVTASNLNSFLKKRSSESSTVTVKNERTILLALWKFAYQNDIIDHMPKNILKIRQKKKPTKAWTIEECKTLIAKTFEKDTLKTKKGVSIGLFLRVWCLLGYESGARLGDVFNFEYSNIEGNILRWTMSKTGDPMTKILSDKLVGYIDDLKMFNKNHSPKILGWICSKRNAQRILRKHLENCGLTGSSKFLRRSGATHIEIDNPGMAKFHLGHRTTGLAEKAYLDYGQLKRNTPVTPKLI
jgi:integrase